MLFFCVVAGSRAAALSCSFRCSNRRSCSLLSSWLECRLGKNAPFGTSKRKRATISRSLVSFSANMCGLIPALWRERRFGTREALTRLSLPGLSSGVGDQIADLGRKRGTKSPNLPILGRKKRSGIPNPAILPVAQAARVPSPAILPEARHLKGAKPRDSVCGVASRGGKPAISTFGPAPRQVCGKCDGWPLVEKVLEAVAPHPYNASLRLCAQRWIHPGAWQDGVAA